MSEKLTAEEISKYYPHAPSGWEPFDEWFGGDFKPDNPDGTYNVTFYGGNANCEMVKYSDVRLDPTDYLWNSCYKLGRINGSFAYVFEQRLWDEETDLDEAAEEEAEAAEVNRQILAQQGRAPQPQPRRETKADIMNYLLNG